VLDQDQLISFPDQPLRNQFRDLSPAANQNSHRSIMKKKGGQRAISD
jgi:hypothetical protein